MMKRNFSLISAQQAPTPETARQACVLVPGTVQTALITPQEITAMKPLMIR
jgi:hypothetical protein